MTLDIPYCAHCQEDLAPDQTTCPMCEEPATDRASAEEAAWERHCEDFYGGSGPLPLLEQQRRAWNEKHGRTYL